MISPFVSWFRKFGNWINKQIDKGLGEGKWTVDDPESDFFIGLFAIPLIALILLVTAIIFIALLVIFAMALF